MDEIPLSVAVACVAGAIELDEETYWQAQWAIMEAEAPQ